MVPHFVPFAWYELSLNVRYVNEHEVRRECGILLRKVQNKRHIYKYSMLEFIIQNWRKVPIGHPK